MKKINTVHTRYKLVHTTKHSFQYQILSNLKENSFLTDRVRIEKFQNYSKGKNFDEYFRTRNGTSWKSGQLITGLYRTHKENVFKGDKKDRNKSLILFKFEKERNILNIYEFPSGYKPKEIQLYEIVNKVA